MNNANIDYIKDKYDEYLNRSAERIIILPDGKKVQVVREFAKRYAVCNIGEDIRTTKNWWLIDK